MLNQEQARDPLGFGRSPGEIARQRDVMREAAEHRLQSEKRKSERLAEARNHVEWQDEQIALQEGWELGLRGVGLDEYIAHRFAELEDDRDERVYSYYCDLVSG
jgi:hypothetical protein